MNKFYKKPMLLKPKLFSNQFLIIKEEGQKKASKIP
jgi:hypothetical protein